MQKLLILGATNHEIDIINRAKAKGIYTIVTDSNTDWTKSPAKYVADEAWDISWSDLDSLFVYCKDNGVNGIIAGFSEFRVENMIKLCSKLNLPCNISLEQLEITRDKFKFKRLCEEYDIPGVPEYNIETAVNFPVIIKPVDRAGSIGINVAYNECELKEFYANAKELSPSGRVIIEEYINDGIKVDFYYYVRNGQPYLLGTSDTEMCKGSLGSEILQKAWLFPSQYQEKYLSSMDSKVESMLKGIGYHNGYATISAFYKDNKFYFFEAGFRFSGDLSYNYYFQISGINYIDTILDFSLGIHNNDDYSNCFEIEGETKSVILNFFGKDGLVKEILTPDFAETPDLIVIPNIYVAKNNIIKNDTSVFKKIAMYTIISKDELKIKNAIAKINSELSVLDANNHDLIYERLDTCKKNAQSDDCFTC